MKKVWLMLTICCVAAIGAGLYAAPSQEPPAKTEAAVDQPVQRFIPDDRPQPWRPWPQPQPKPEPERSRVIEAETIVLNGPECRITLTAIGRRPGVFVESRKGGRFVVYFGPEGQAVAGITTPDRKELAAGLFTSRGKGLIQMADKWGIHVFSGEELSRAAGKLK